MFCNQQQMVIQWGFVGGQFHRMELFNVNSGFTRGPSNTQIFCCDSTRWNSGFLRSYFWFMFCISRKYCCPLFDVIVLSAKNITEGVEKCLSSLQELQLQYLLSRPKVTAAASFWWVVMFLFFSWFSL